MERDLQDEGLDLGDDTLMTTRSWRWLESRVLGLLDRPVGYDLAGNPIFTSRLQRHFAPPPAQTSREGTRP